MPPPPSPSFPSSNIALWNPLPPPFHTHPQGMNTDDMVWLDEEKEREKKGGSLPPKSAKALGAAPAEKDSFPGEFLSEPADEGGKPGAGGKPLSTLSKEGGNWVTDEFESYDYEAGNLETLWDMHLWDREGKPLMMPEGPPDEAMVSYWDLRWSFPCGREQILIDFGWLAPTAPSDPS